MDAIDGWIEDHGNFDTMGHRRWVLYPPMKSTGFGYSGFYSSMYCFDNTFQDSNYKNVVKDNNYLHIISLKSWITKIIIVSCWWCWIIFIFILFRFL